MSTIIMMAVLTTVLSLTSCQKESPSLNSDKISDQAALKVSSNISAEKSGAPLKVDLVHIYIDVEDAAHITPPTGNNTLLYNHTLPHTQVLAPDGHPVTLGEFNMVSGWADVKCINEGTHVVVHLKGLIPNGLYTLWILRFDTGTPGPPSGVGALGAPDGSENLLKVNSKGTADLSVTMSAESPLSIFGSIPNCWSSVFKVMVAGAYHLDGQTHGASPGGAGGFSTYVLQFGFPVMGAKL